mgnify:CR=1 FL=1
MSFADIAGKTMLDIVAVLRKDGMSYEAIAATLNLTINGFRAKMRRLESTYRNLSEDDDRRQTLLERIYAFVDDHGSGNDAVRYADIDEHFHGVKKDSLAGVLHYLVQCGLLSVTGRGLGRAYRTVPPQQTERDLNVQAAVVLYREGPMDLKTLSQRLGQSEADCKTYIESIRVRGELETSERPDGVTCYQAKRYHIPVGSSEGFESALWDHLSVAVKAICKKVRVARLHSAPDDRLGGTTFSFVVPKNSKIARDIGSFLSEARAQMEAWKAEVEALDETALDDTAERERISIYTGQMVEDLVTTTSVEAMDQT